MDKQTKKIQETTKKARLEKSYKRHIEKKKSLIINDIKY